MENSSLDIYLTDSLTTFDICSTITFPMSHTLNTYKTATTPSPGTSNPIYTTPKSLSHSNTLYNLVIWLAFNIFSPLAIFKVLWEQISFVVHLKHLEECLDHKYSVNICCSLLTFRKDNLSENLNSIFRVLVLFLQQLPIKREVKQRMC